jgi:four helix bundle protein
MTKPHQKLDVWKKSIDFVATIYRITGGFPSEEKFGLVSQMRRAAISIPSNISEGAGRNNPREFNHFLGVAQGSSAELETQIIISRNLGFLEEAAAAEILQELDTISKMMVGLRRSLRDRG